MTRAVRAPHAVSGESTDQGGDGERDGDARSSSSRSGSGGARRRPRQQPSKVVSLGNRLNSLRYDIVFFVNIVAHWPDSSDPWSQSQR